MTTPSPTTNPTTRTALVAARELLGELRDVYRHDIADARDDDVPSDPAHVRWLEGRVAFVDSVLELLNTALADQWEAPERDPGDRV